MNIKSLQIIQPPSIPTTVRVGVTGHRKLTDEPLMRARIRDVLSQLDQRLQHTPHTFTVVSPLAEGADRLVAGEVLNWHASGGMPKPSLEVPLPLPEADYRQDFHTQASQDEFSDLLQSAVIKLDPPTGISRETAYQQVGHYVVHHCDILVAIWDGEPAAGTGGTAEIFKYAHEFSRTIFQIDPGSGEIKQINGLDHSLEALLHLDTYNNEHLSDQAFKKAVEDLYNEFNQKAEKIGLNLEPLLDHLLPQYIQADMLAKKYQSRHSIAGGAIYLLATLAVAIVAIQKILLFQFASLVFLEVLAMILILLWIYLSSKGDWHRKWIDYRSLSERLRSAIYLSLVGADCTSNTSSADNLFDGSREWMIKAFETIWERCSESNLNKQIPINSLKEFVLDSWINSQMMWFTEKGEQHRHRHERLAQLGVVFFGLTLVAALIHATRIIYLWIPESNQIPEDWLTLFAIVFPAAGAALAGSRVHRDYERNAERYASMVPVLKIIIEQIESSNDISKLTHWMEKANEVLLSENQDWRMAFLFQKLELP